MGVVLLLWAWYFLCSSGITSVCVVFTSVFVVLPFWAFLSSMGVVIASEGVALPFPGVGLPLWAWFYLCRRGFIYVGEFNICGRGFTSVGVVFPL